MCGSKLEEVASATTLEQLYDCIGQDFYVIVPTPSMLHSAHEGGVNSFHPRESQPKLLEGTRITLVKALPDKSMLEDGTVSSLEEMVETEGFEFTIRTPSKPYRWSLFERECEGCFDRLEETLLNVCSAEHVSEADEVLLTRALELFYWWVTFAPLSRGTAACGYAALQSVVISAGRIVTRPLPKGEQLDWEVCSLPLLTRNHLLIVLRVFEKAILAADCAQFISKVRAWFLPLSSCETLPWWPLLSNDLFTCVNTLRDMLDLLSLSCQSQGAEE